MAKKFGKFLLFTAVAGAAVAGTYYYLKNKGNTFSDDMDEDDDFDNFDDDLDEGNTHDSGIKKEEAARNYVNLNLEKAENSAVDAASHLKAAGTEAVKNTAGEVKEAADNLGETAKSKVEEFFDDEDEDNSSDSI